MELNKLYDIAENENIKIYNHELDNANGIFVNINNINAIALDYKKFDTSTKEKCVLAEELGHYYQDATYSPLCSDVSFISRQEFKAKKWAFKTLVSPSKIKKSVSKGLSCAYEIAEELGVTEDMFNLAYQYYKENNLLEELQCV